MNINAIAEAGEPTTEPGTAGGKIVPLNVRKARQRRANVALARFKIISFTNPRTGTESFRVAGSKRNGERVRENFTDHKAAECRRLELETEYLGKQTETAIRATKLTDDQINLAEKAFAKLDDDANLVTAVCYWLDHGRPVAASDCPRLDDAVSAFMSNLDDAEAKRFHAKRNLRTRVNLFANSIGNLRLDSITVDTVEKFLNSRNVSARTKINDRSAISTFFRWCAERPRFWIRHNPTREALVENPEDKTVAVFTLAECKKILTEARTFKDGKLLPYVVAGLFGGLRPYEIQRLPIANVNLADCEIRIEPSMTKTKRGRTVKFNDGPKEQKPFNAALIDWLKVCKGKPFWPPNAENDLSQLKARCGYGTTEPLRPWPVDIMRHTAISHYFRLTGSYGYAAEMFGNSETKIKKHYQGRVSSADTKAFYALRPAKGVKS